MERRKHSKVNSLPKELREATEQLHQAGRTYTQITEYLRDHGTDIDRSSVGRWDKAFSARLERIKLAAQRAEAVIREMGDRPVTEIYEAAEKVATQALLDVMLEMPEGASEIKFIDAARAIAALQNSAMRRECTKIAIAKDAEERAARAAKEIDKIGAKAKLSPDVLAQIREQVYGIVPQSGTGVRS